MGGEAALKSETSLYQNNPVCRVWGRFATHRGMNPLATVVRVV